MEGWRGTGLWGGRRGIPTTSKGSRGVGRGTHLGAQGIETWQAPRRLSFVRRRLGLTFGLFNVCRPHVHDVDGWAGYLLLGLPSLCPALRSDEVEAVAAFPRGGGGRSASKILFLQPHCRLCLSQSRSDNQNALKGLVPLGYGGEEFRAQRASWCCVGKSLAGPQRMFELPPHRCREHNLAKIISQTAPTGIQFPHRITYPSKSNLRW